MYVIGQAALSRSYKGRRFVLMPVARISVEEKRDLRMDFNTFVEIIEISNVREDEAKKVISSFLEEHQDLEDLLQIQLEGLLHSI